MAVAAPDPLLAIQQEFPHYRIWREDIAGRVRYIARSLGHGLRPHTVVTGDLAELHGALEPSQYAQLIPLSADVPSGDQYPGWTLWVSGTGRWWPPAQPS